MYGDMDFWRARHFSITSPVLLVELQSILRTFDVGSQMQNYISLLEK